MSARQGLMAIMALIPLSEGTPTQSPMLVLQELLETKDTHRRRVLQ